jgi:hypothetical protein
MTEKVAGFEGITPEQQKYIQDEFKIPVDSFNPGTYWIVSLDSESTMPADQELKQIASFREYIIKKTYNERFAEKLLQMPLPASGGCNTTIFCKRASGDEAKEPSWFYRKMTWQYGTLYAPDSSEKNYRPLSIVEVMDQRETILSSVSEEWIAWKEKHPDIFPNNPR